MDLPVLIMMNSKHLVGSVTLKNRVTVLVLKNVP